MSILSVKNDNIADSSFINAQKPIPPTVSGYSVSGIDDVALDPAGGQTVLLNGTGFQRGATITLNGSAIAVVSFVSANQLSFTSPALSAGTYTIYVVNADLGTAIYIPGLIYSNLPTWTTAAGSLGSYYETTSISNTVVATGDAPLTYSLYSGTLPTGSTLYANGLISGTAPVDSGSTTYSFTIQATDAQLQDSTRSFSLTINTDIVTWVNPANGATINLDGTAYSNALSATDAAGYAVSYTANALPTGLTLSAGTISGTPTVEGNTTTLLTATAATTNRSATNTVTWVVSLSDTYFKYVTTLLSTSTPTTLPFNTDTSLNNNLVSVTGDTKPFNSNPYTAGYYSNYFDGTGDYLTSTVPALGAGDFTIEFWMFQQINECHIFTYAPSWANATGVSMIYYSGSNNYCVAVGNANNNYFGGLLRDQWVHVAIVRSSGTVKVYFNGVASATTLSTTTDLTATGINIGYSTTSPAWASYAGYISNFRVVAGTAVYTSNFTPNTTTPLLPISGTRLLTCQAYKLQDSSLTGATIIRNGDVAVRTFSPYTTSYPLQQTSTTSYSTYFSGASSDYVAISSAANSALAFPSNATGGFTFEFWVYPMPITGATWYCDIGGCWTGTVGQVWWEITISNSYINVNLGNNGFGSSSGNIQRAVTITPFQWSMIVIQRRSDGTNWDVYLNGVSGGTPITSPNNFNLYSPAAFLFGSCYTATTTTCSPYYISNFRFSSSQVYGNGTSFTVPTSPLTAVSGVPLLLAQGTNILQNNGTNSSITFIQNGTSTKATASIQNPFTAITTSYGNTAITTYGSTYFDGNADYLSLTSSGAFLFGSGSFTVECWYNATALGVSQTLLGIWDDSSTTPQAWLLYMNTSNKIVFVIDVATTDTVILTSSYTVVIGQWVHVAVVRSGNTWYLFINGVLDTTATNSSTISAGTGPLCIGGYSGASAANKGSFNGYISNVRIVKGTAVYTSNFAVPTSPLTAITNTTLLTCQSNQPVTNNTVLDKSTTAYSVVRAGNTTQGTFSPYGANWSLYAAGRPQVSASYTFAGDCTIEGWFYITSWAAQQFIMDGRSNNNTNVNFNWANGVITNENSGTILSYTAPTMTNTWNHMAFVRSGSTVTMYVNGVSAGTGTYASSFSIGTVNFLSRWDGTYASTGYISNFRIVNGTAVYTGAFTPPTSPLLPIAKTVLLTCNSNRPLDTSPNNSTCTIGSGSMQKYSPFAGATLPTPYYSGYFDGTGDYLSVADSTVFTIGSGSMTVEAWIYPMALPSSGSIANIGAQWATSNEAWLFAIYNNSGTLQLLWQPTSGVTQTIISYNYTFAVGTWYHVAAVRNSNTVTLYVNGSSIGSTTYSSTVNDSSTALTVGSRAAADLPFTGYISNFRFVVGYAVYTGNFTPSTTPLTAVTGTQLLTCQSNTFIDNSTNNFTVTVNGDSKPLAVSPFTLSYSTKQVYTTSVIGGSMYFDGTGDYVYTASALTLAGDFTIEGWVNQTATNASGAVLLSIGNEVASRWVILIFPTTISYNVYGSGSVTIGSFTFSTNTWYHVAVVRSGTTLAAYVNGVRAGSVTLSGTLGNTGGYYVGASSTATSTITGYLSDLRLTNGSAVYTSTFYPLNAPLTPVKNTTLLLNSTSAGIMDSSEMTDYETLGDTRMYNFGPYNAGYYSISGGGSAPSASWSTFTGQFTVEAWLYYSSAPSAGWSIGGNTAGAFIPWYYNGSNFGPNIYGTGNIFTSSAAPIVGQWFHIAVTRNASNIMTLWFNGVSAGSATNSSTFVQSVFSLGVGGTGYISNVRMVSGTCLYTSTFTPSTTPLTAISGTQLLACQSNKFVDNSTNAATLTIGTAAVQPQNPFQLNSGQSIKFDGTGDYLYAIASPNFGLGSGDFTIETWLYPLSNASNQMLYGSTTTGALFIRLGQNAGTTFNGIQVGRVATANDTFSAYTFTLNTWYHIAVSRASGTMKIFINGTQLNSFSNTTDFGASTSVRIGTTETGTEYLNAYLSDFRLTKGYARYTSSFTPPTDPFKRN